MARIEQASNNLCDMLMLEMARVELLRGRLNKHNSAHVLPEFLMRRLLLRGRLALQQRNNTEALRMWNALKQVSIS